MVSFQYSTLFMLERLWFQNKFTGMLIYRYYETSAFNGEGITRMFAEVLQEVMTKSSHGTRWHTHMVTYFLTWLEREASQLVDNSIRLSITYYGFESTQMTEAIIIKCTLCESLGEERLEIWQSELFNHDKSTL